MDGPEGWESMTRGYRCVGSGSQTFCPWEAVAEMEWRGRYLEMKSRDGEPGCAMDGPQRPPWMVVAVGWREGCELIAKVFGK